jgi:hypothetical protein
MDVICVNKSPMARFFLVLVFLFATWCSGSAQKSSRYKMAMKYEDVSGFCDIVEISGGLGLGHTAHDYTGSYAGIGNVLGYVIDHHFIIGLGVAANAYNGGALFPIYLDIRYRFRKREFTPFLYADGGGLINANDFLNYALFINPGIGVIKRINNNSAFTMSIGFFTQSVADNNSSFINVKLGVIFFSNGVSSCQQ